MEIMSSSIFDLGPILAKKCYFCHFLQFLHAQYSIDRYINDRYDLTNVLEQENFFNFLKKNFFIICLVFSNTLQMTYLKITSSEGYWKILCLGLNILYKAREKVLKNTLSRA